MSKPAYVYIVADPRRTVYLDIAKDLDVAVLRDRTSSGLDLRLVAYEEFPTMVAAKERLEALRKGREAEILLLVANQNPTWKDLLPPTPQPPPDPGYGEDTGIGILPPDGPPPLTGSEAKKPFPPMPKT